MVEDMIPKVIPTTSPGPDEIARMKDHAREAVRLLKDMAHETRLLILCHLWEEELSVGEINQRIGISQSALSQHLALLRAEGLVSTRRQTQNIFYRLTDRKATSLLTLLHGLYCPQEKG